MSTLIACAHESDGLYAACQSTLPMILKIFSESSPDIQPIISLGLPRVIMPARNLLTRPILHVYESNPMDPFNTEDYQGKGSSWGYKRWAGAQLEECGWEDYQFHFDNVREAVYDLGIHRNPYLMLLDTCNINTLREFRQDLKRRGFFVHPHSIVMFNTQPERCALNQSEHGTPAHRAAQDLFDYPVLLEEVKYRARGMKQPLRTLSFYTGSRIVPRYIKR